MEKKSYIINGEEIFIIPKPFLGTKSLEFYEKKIFSAFKRIGVRSKHIKIIKKKDGSVVVTWNINGNQFRFVSSSQENLRKNLGAAAQAIEEDVRQILRGIKDINLTLKQYSINESDNQNSIKSGTLNEFLKNNPLEEFNPKELSLLNNFNDSTYELDPKYKFLLKKSNDELKILYFKMKDRCLKDGRRDHPFLKALNFIIKKKNIKI